MLGPEPMKRALLVLVLLLAPSLAQAQARDPSVQWRTIDTPHFTIHYHIPLGVLARRVALVAERAHSTLTEILGNHADRRTHIALSDGTDGANGSAIAVPYNVIRLNATAPSAMSPLGDYDDWLNMLVTHEHTHIVQLDQWSGVASFINILLGKVYAPNHVQPRWILEGIATWQETERTSAGRGRSTMFDMYLRMDALEDRFFDIDQLSNIADRWPHGNIWYLYGSRFIEYVANRHGREAIATFVREYGDEVIPWGINRVAARATGQSWVDLYEEFRVERRRHYEAQRDAIIAAGRVEGERLTHHGEIARTPRFLPDGRVGYRRDDRRTRSRVAAFDLERPGDQETLARRNGDPGWDMHPSGRYVVFAQADNVRDIYAFHDLFRRDLETGRIDRLTTGWRAREPDISPDGRRVTFTTNLAGTTHLWVAELRDVEGTARRLIENERFDQVFNPRFSPDGRTIAVSRWQRGGYRDVQLIDVATGRVAPITHDRALDVSPAWSADGRTLYFSSDRTGVANIYAFRLATGRLTQVTNVVSGAYQPAVSADGRHLVYVGYTSFGFDLFHLDLSTSSSRPAPPYIDRRPAAVVDDEVWTGPSRDYQPLETMYPRAYMLSLTADGFGPALGVEVRGEDLAGWHHWSLRGTTGFLRGDINGELGWRYTHSPLGLRARVFRRVAPRGGLSVGGQNLTWVEHAVGGEVGLSYRFFEAFRSQAVALTYRATYVDKLESFPGRLDPNEAPPIYPRLGLRSELRLSWGYSDVERYGYDISPSAGRGFGFTLAFADPAIGSTHQAVDLTWFFRQYLRMPWGEHHVLAVNYQGGISGSELGRRGTFSIGGFPEIDIASAAINGQILGGAALRGYPAFDRSGPQMHLLQLEYRLPIWRINRGVLTLPVYLNRLSAAAFVDAGDAFYGQLDLSTFRIGVGAQILLDFTIAYLLPFTLRVGYARGLMDGGLHQVYGHLGVPF